MNRLSSFALLSFFGFQFVFAGYATDTFGREVLRTLALSDEQAPGTNSRFASFRYVLLNDAGQIAIQGYLKWGSGVSVSNDNGIWVGTEGSLRLIAREGGDVPGTFDGTKFDRLNVPRINGAGMVAFGADLRGPNVNSNNESSMWTDSGGPLRLVARSGNPAAGVDTKFYDRVFSLNLNDYGQIAFWATLKPSPSVLAPDGGIWVERNDALALVARHGMQAPGFPQGVILQSLNGLRLSNDSEFTFTGIARSGDGSTSGLWVDRNGVQSLIAMEGMQAPGAPVGHSFHYFSDVRQITGSVAFLAGLKNEFGEVFSVGTDGVWIENSGSLEFVAKASSQAPGTPDGTYFYSFDDLRLNRSGDTAFFAFLKGDTVTAQNQSAIFSEVNGKLRLVARQDTPPGVPYGTRFTSYLHTQFAFNDAGQVAFSAELTGADVNLRTQQGPPEIVNDHGIWGQDRNGVLRLVVRAGDVIDVDDGPGVDLRRINALRLTALGDSNSQGFNNLGQLAFAASFNDGSSGVFITNVLAVPEPTCSQVILFFGAILVTACVRSIVLVQCLS